MRGDILNLRGNLSILVFEVSERLSDSFDEVFECSRGGLSQRCFELSECLFDWIEVGARGRQIA